MNPSDGTLKELLRSCRSIAVVGLSAQPDRPSHRVAAYLQAQGYQVIPVNPQLDTVLGERCYPDLAAIGHPVDLVDVFRKPQDCLPVAQAAVALGAKALWLQLGVVDEAAARTAQAGGLTVVMDRCLMVEHARLLGR